MNQIGEVKKHINENQRYIFMYIFDVKGFVDDRTTVPGIFPPPNQTKPTTEVKKTNHRSVSNGYGES